MQPAVRRRAVSPARYADVLGLDAAALSADDNFFTLGGTSLKAVVLARKVDFFRSLFFCSPIE